MKGHAKELPNTTRQNLAGCMFIKTKPLPGVHGCIMLQEITAEQG